MKGSTVHNKFAPLLMMSDIRDILTHKSAILMRLYNTEPLIHMSIDANDEDQCQHAKKRDLPVKPHHRGVRVREDMRMEEKKV